MGGVFNTVNANLYHYAGNNPVKYTDPDGNSLFGVIASIGCYIGAGAVLIGGAAATTTGQIYLTVGAVKLSFALAAAGTVFAADAINDASKNGQASLLSGFNGSASASTASPSPLPPDPNDKNDDRNDKKKPTTQNQMQKQVEKGQAPKDVDRVDKPHQQGQQNHVHFKDGTAMNQDGTIHDRHRGIPNPSNEVKNWLENNGWITGE